MYNSVVDTPFFKDIVEYSDRELVESRFTLRTFPKGQILYSHGDEGHEMYIIKTGALKIYRQDDHHEIIFGHQFPGEAIGELEIFHHDNTRTASVATIEKTTLWMIKRQDMDELVKLYPEILRKTIYILSERLNQADRKLEYLAFLDTRIRVANLLLDLHSNFGVNTGDGVFINWRITQQHFAQMIGVGRETAARVLQELQSERIIRIQARHIYILDLTALTVLAGVQPDHNEGRIWHSTHKYDIPSL
ncbi:Crp/Fnr family transcriptional regulator [Paenibacillus sp. FSL P4-0338]|uniref:Crp/Fnr family transcriptional regulator n=1 Tax=Paenibacillus sp. FSL P4-0338 TaxID=2921635 RepID=UPI0030FCD458